MNGDTGHASIQTFTGRFVKPYELTKRDVNVRDIAHALSNVCRFQGHTREFYSVAQHCVICSIVVADHEVNALPALLHDATEAYACDLAGPLKRDTQLGRLYKEVEGFIATTVEAALGLPFRSTTSDAVKEADWAVLQVEGRQLMPANDWARQDVLPWLVIKPMPPAVAEAAFLSRYGELQASA